MYYKYQRLVFSRRGVLPADRMNDKPTNYCMPRGSAHRGIIIVIIVQAEQTAALNRLCTACNMYHATLAKLKIAFLQV